MHYHLEIIMPPTEDVKTAVATILAPFNEQPPDGEKEDHDPRGVFWDWYVIGGRWSGAKRMHALGDENLKAFHDEITARNITVSGLQMGKPTLQPASQIPAVDALWLEMFPDAGFAACPVFDHYKGDMGDMLRLDELAPNLEASRVIIAAPGFRDKLAAQFMISEDAWNGVIHAPIAWDGKIATALEMHIKRISHYSKDARAKYTPQPDWLVVTVDYHS